MDQLERPRLRERILTGENLPPQTGEFEAGEFLVWERDLWWYANTQEGTLQGNRGTATRVWNTLYTNREDPEIRDLWEQAGLEIIEIPAAHSEEPQYALSGKSLVHAAQTAALGRMPGFSSRSNKARQLVEGFVSRALDELASIGL